MNDLIPCRCCLLRPPDKNLKSSYTCFDKTEVYADMLKECFEINFTNETTENDNGICDVCIVRLRDAFEFKHQVIQCQKDFQLHFNKIKDESPPNVKEELADDDNEIFYLELKEELSDIETLKEDENLAEILGLDEISIKKKSSKKRLLKSESSSKKNTFKSNINITLRKPAFSDIRIVSEHKKHAANVENIIKYSNCTPFSNKTLSGIVCAFCKETYTSTQELRTHTQDAHKKPDLTCKRVDKNNLSIKMDITNLKCTLCDASVHGITSLKDHLTEHHNIKFFPDVYDYILEFKLTDEEVLNCALCNSKYETFKMLLQHMNGHYRNYICEVCDMGFINKHRLKNHQRTHDVGNFKCSFCDKVFSTRVRKMCHEKYTHNTNARYTTNCPHCDQSFTSYYQRNRHMSNEHNVAAATYKCNICDKSFILKSKLTAHIKKVHLMERNHICPECGQGFFIKQSLDEHMIKHNGERVFKCTVCYKSYARKKTLREHMRIHNNDRRFKCGVCGLAFVQKCSMKSHMLSNHGLSLTEYLNTKHEVST
ncbi:gastrula zinc finger protein XlCGF57.1-like [Aricia agestis]|uniref:gastrula zinc finger protein XlCGF57.1-like n=1 Tax=Aricia agestis TaxID=91739 RepID=UPI001C2077E9|nr:gastrula zinc finger protein XlCGF57.1-like [Aricia agestis]